MGAKEHGIKGRIVTAKEVLNDLGPPSEWWKLTLNLAFKSRLRGEATELDLHGIIGSPGFPGYLSILQLELAEPSGTGTNGLISHDIESRVRATVQQEIPPLIQKYEALRNALLADAGAVEQYVEHVRGSLKVLCLYHPQDPEMYEDDEMRTLIKEGNERTEADIAASHKTIEEYTALAAKLRATT